MENKNERQIGYDILYDIIIQKKYSNLAINETLRKSKISIEKKRYITTIIYGVVENLLNINTVIEKVFNKNINKINNRAYIILLIGIYELKFMEKSEYAPVNEYVNLAKKIAKSQVRLINYGLREYLREKDKINTIIDKDIYLKYSTSKWVMDELIKDFGKESAIKFIEKSFNKKKIYIKINERILSISEYEKKLELRNIIYKTLDNGLIELISNYKNIYSLPGYDKGYFIVIDYGAYDILYKLINSELPKNLKILDACSAPGGKLFSMMIDLDKSNEFYAYDIYEHKINLMKKTSDRLNLNNVNFKTVDFTTIEESKEKFDIILLDAPCSGLGIIRRKPEIKYTMNSEKSAEIDKLQSIMLKKAVKCLRPSGILIYSTCTTRKEENENQIKKILEINKDMMLIEEYNINIDEIRSDYFYASKLKKRGN